MQKMFTSRLIIFLLLFNVLQYQLYEKNIVFFLLHYVIRLIGGLIV